jgi:hypothetical protein
MLCFDRISVAEKLLQENLQEKGFIMWHWDWP